MKILHKLKYVNKYNMTSKIICYPHIHACYLYNDDYDDLMVRGCIDLLMEFDVIRKYRCHFSL